MKFIDLRIKSEETRFNQKHNIPKKKHTQLTRQQKISNGLQCDQQTS